MVKSKGNMPSTTRAGIIYSSLVISMTVFSVVLLEHNVIVKGHVQNLVALMILVFLGASLVVCGFTLYLNAVLLSLRFSSSCDGKNIFHTTGVYAFVRNPRLSAVMLMCSGFILMLHNICLFLLLPLYWLLLTVVMVLFEDKRMMRIFGEEYFSYCMRVNRCIPWFPRN